MIQAWLVDNLKSKFPDMLWTYDFMPREDDVITIYYEGGGDPGRFDVPYRHPRYMFYLSSSSWDYLDTIAQTLYEEVPELEGQRVTIILYEKDGTTVRDTTEYYIQSITPSGDINPLGTVEDIRRYSINFDVTLVEIKEEN